MREVNGIFWDGHSKAWRGGETLGVMWAFVDPDRVEFHYTASMVVGKTQTTIWCRVDTNPVEVKGNVNYHRGKRSEPLRTDWPAHVQANEAAQRAALAFTLDVMEAHPDMATIGKLEYVGRDIAFHRKQIAQLQDQMAEHHETIEERMQDRGRLRAALNDPATWPVAKETEE